jgi:hypothetical protein
MMFHGTAKLQLPHQLRGKNRTIIWGILVVYNAFPYIRCGEVLGNVNIGITFGVLLLNVRLNELSK